ncbi:YaiO family outer membrane beta-barrel protein [Lysobacter solisilvae (ex Woo and Kim 2020)]|uniref:YaiO family outer membrane beta-barrel protein n=1 Tax=Agrilutibacter terrestris TaxID=2865112 RepID=A0A7H0G0Q0_9GAMM|nr:YaiO family outer membrane beta-barrel protein [Lysobacter terrestris]QNP41866.1 YaiO family outer membrane beta-barrel protein [Lysobacter terrestris]
MDSNTHTMESSMRRGFAPLTAQTLALACALALAPQVRAQEATAAESYEQQFARAHELATGGRRQEAVTLYTAMLQASPDNSDVRLARGRTQAWMERWPEAEADLVAVTAAKPDYADAWSALGDMYLWSDRPQQAAGAYARWSELRPDDPAAAIALGRAHRAAGDRDAARIDFEAARARGADAAQVDDYLASLQPRIVEPDAVLPAGYLWALRVGGTHTSFDPSSRDDWNEYEVALRRKFTRGSLALEMLQARRFDQHDTAWALDGYASLWERAYANVRYQRGPSGDLYPGNAWRVELFQGVGSGWELSGSYDHLEFDGSDTDMYGVGVGRYFGDFYARYRVLHVPGVGSGSLSHRGQLRWYYAGNADDYFEASVSHGRSHERDTGGFDRVVGDSHSSYGVTYVKFFAPQLGFKLGADFANDVDGFDERSVSASLYARW